MYRIKIIIILFFLPCSVFAQRKPLLSYTPLSNAAKKTNQLDNYKNISSATRKITIDDISLEVKIPLKVNAYDVIPIRYTIKKPSTKKNRLAVEAVAFEDVEKVQDRQLYDLAIPGNMEVKIDYLGSISADYDQQKYTAVTTDPNTLSSQFPPYNRDKMVRSSTIRAADIIWFKFRITNTGDTILDPEGFSSCFVEPYLIKLDDDGNEEWKAKTNNLFVRFLEYLYPGDSVELWVSFNSPKKPDVKRLGLDPGNYRIDYRLVARFYDKYDWMANIWSGTEFARLEVPIKVAEKAVEIPVTTKMKMTGTDNRMPGYFAKFEEFMTSFNIHPYHFNQPLVKDTIYLQVAPWTKAITIKLISDNPRSISVVRVPIEINHDTLAIKYNPDNIMVINKNGKEEPVFVAQAMPGMRTGFKLDPFPEKRMLDDIAEMKELGVNLIANTCVPTWARGTGSRQPSSSYQYFFNFLVRKFNMKLLGWSVYPGSHAPERVAEETLYNYQHWGDIWFVTKDDRIPVDIEETFGWMRDDINIRYKIADKEGSLEQFQEWVKAKYCEIERVNEAWNSSYPDFNSIDPEKNQGIEDKELGLTRGPVYNLPDHPFHDWSPAVNDWDVFRTEFRLERFQKAFEIIREKIPNAEVSLRTEGGNLAVKSNPNSDNMHMRHVYYSQRRCAIIYDVLKEKNIVRFHSDYTTMPYTQAQWRQAMKEMVADGIIPIYLPQFDHMRDILLNPHYGREYQMHYNLDKPSKGIMVHCLMAAYPWWKATYEEGGAPGILWSDYLCDGFATETQKRELKLLTKYFKSMKKN